MNAWLNIFVLGPELNNWILDIKEMENERVRESERLSCRIVIVQFATTISYGFLPCWQNMFGIRHVKMSLVHLLTVKKLSPKNHISTFLSIFPQKLKLKFKSNKSKCENTQKRVEMDGTISEFSIILMRCMHACLR